MKKIISIILFISINSIVNSQVTQQWAVTYNGPGNGIDIPAALGGDTLGNVYVTGVSFGGTFSFNDYATIKYNSDGVQQWVKRYSGIGSDYANSITVDFTGNVSVTGKRFASSSGYDYATLKYNSAGVQQWAQTYNAVENLDDEAAAITKDASGNIYVTGRSVIDAIPNYKYTTIKYNSSGVQQWSSIWTTTGNPFPRLAYKIIDIAVDRSRNVYISGVTRFQDQFGFPNYDNIIIKYNSNGIFQWSKSLVYPHAGAEFEAARITLDGLGYLYTSMFHISYDGYSLEKLNSSGVPLFSTPIPFANEIQSSPSLDAQGNIYICGKDSNSNFFAAKYSSSGILVWEKTYSIDSISLATSIISTSTGVYITGYSEDHSAPYHHYGTIKYDFSGNQQWVQTYYIYSTSIDLDYPSMFIDKSENVIVSSSYPGINKDYLTLKYKQNVSVNIQLAPEGYYNTSTLKLNKRDTIYAYLRSTTSPFTKIDSAKGVIDSNTFTGKFNFNNAQSNSGTYYIEVKHRNSIETWSKSGGQSLTKGNTLIYNFTSSASQAYGNNEILKGTKYCIYSGDVNQDGSVDLSDLSLIDNDSYNFASGYLNSDVNGDGFIDLSDLTITDNNSLRFVSVIRP